MADKPKVSKTDANYRRGSPTTRCSMCAHFRHGMADDPDSCTIVAGKIEPGMVSDYFRRR